MLSLAIWSIPSKFNIAMENDPFIDGLPIKHGNLSISMADLRWLCLLVPWAQPSPHRGGFCASHGAAMKFHPVLAGALAVALARQARWTAPQKPDPELIGFQMIWDYFSMKLWSITILRIDEWWLIHGLLVLIGCTCILHITSQEDNIWGHWPPIINDFLMGKKWWGHNGDKLGDTTSNMIIWVCLSLKMGHAHKNAIFIQNWRIFNCHVWFPVGTLW